MTTTQPTPPTPDPHPASPAPGGLAISATHPDAAPQPGDDTIRIACHVLALAALVLLLAYCVVVAPRHSSAAATPVVARATEAA